MDEPVQKIVVHDPCLYTALVGSQGLQTCKPVDSNQSNVHAFLNPADINVSIWWKVVEGSEGRRLLLNGMRPGIKPGDYLLLLLPTGEFSRYRADVVKYAEDGQTLEGKQPPPNFFYIEADFAPVDVTSVGSVQLFT